MLLTPLVILALSALGALAYEPNPDAVPRQAGRVAYCSFDSGIIGYYYNGTRFPPYSLRIYNATFASDNGPSFPNISSTPIETIPLPGLTFANRTYVDNLGRNFTTVSYQYTVNVPYGNYYNADIVDPNGTVVVGSGLFDGSPAIRGKWVGKGQGTCDQSALGSIPYDAASMSTTTSAAASTSLPPATFLLAFSSTLIGVYTLV